VEVSEPDRVLTVSTANAGSITLECPKDEFSGSELVSREFVVIADIAGSDDEFVRVKFADGVRIINHVTDGEKNDLFIKGGRRSMFMFRQIRNTDGFDTYLVTDLNANNITSFIENLKKDLEAEVGERKDNDTIMTG